MGSKTHPDTRNLPEMYDNSRDLRVFQTDIRTKSRIMHGFSRDLCVPYRVFPDFKRNSGIQAGLQMSREIQKMRNSHEICTKKPKKQAGRMCLVCASGKTGQVFWLSFWVFSVFSLSLVVFCVGFCRVFCFFSGGTWHRPEQAHRPVEGVGRATAFLAFLLRGP